MNEHRSYVPLRVHRLLLGILLFLEGFQTEFIDHGVCFRCLCDGRERSVACKGIQLEEIFPLPFETRYLDIDRSCGGSGRLTADSSSSSYTFRAVSITNSCLKTFNVNAFRNLENLVKLDLSGNVLTRFDSFENVKFDNLKYLILDRNNFVNISTDFLSSLPKLESLSIRDNAVHDVKAFTESFRDLYKLSLLDLRGNPLGKISIDGFVNLPPSLRTLTLSDCQLVAIHDDAFRNLSDHLEDLDISGNHLSLNQLKGLFLGFKPQSAIKVLRLSRLDIEEIPPDPLWSRMPNLETLDFTGNRIDDVSYVAFTGLRLKKLCMDYNRITTLGDVENETTLQHLVVWSLSNNRLTNIPILNLPLLTSIHLGMNKITQIIPSHFSSMPNIKSINLTKNAISDIDALTFDGLKVRSLDLSGNDIKRWEWTNGLQIVEYLNVSGNSLTYFSSEVLKSTGESLVSLDFTSNEIRDVAHDSFSTLPSLRHLRLGGNSFGQHIESGSLLPLFRDLPDLTSLDLSNMALATIPQEQFGNLTSLRRLYLSDNMISKLCDTSSRHLEESLHVFDVKRNRLKEIDTDYLKHLPSLKKVNFANNPFHCSCAVDSFRQWINDSKIEVVDFRGKGYDCTSPESARGVPLRAYEAQDCHDTQMSKLQIVIAYSVGSFLLICIIVVVVSFSFKRCAFCKKPRYAYVGGDEFEWSGKRRILYVFILCRKMRGWCPRRDNKNFYIKHSNSQPLTERTVC
ncbi:toll-like receptor 4 [Lineus longissimus]|uniref:toll-like receptor 4 n=1 Tax=Lineus longissimus TaxID=88925 RepID=UPI00315D87BA